MLIRLAAAVAVGAAATTAGGHGATTLDAKVFADSAAIRHAAFQAHYLETHTNASIPQKGAVQRERNLQAPACEGACPVNIQVRMRGRDASASGFYINYEEGVGLLRALPAPTNPKILRCLNGPLNTILNN